MDYITISYVFLRLGFTPMPTMVSRYDTEKTLFRVSITGTQKLVQLFNQQTFRRLMLLVGREPGTGYTYPQSPRGPWREPPHGSAVGPTVRE